MTSEKKSLLPKVVVNKYPAFIPLDRVKETIVIGKTIVFKSDNLNMSFTLFKEIDGKTYVLNNGALGYTLCKITDLFIKEEVVRFKDIEDYTHYQTELNFGEESI